MDRRSFQKWLKKQEGFNKQERNYMEHLKGQMNIIKTFVDKGQHLSGGTPESGNILRQIQIHLNVARKDDNEVKRLSNYLKTQISKIVGKGVLSTEEVEILKEANKTAKYLKQMDKAVTTGAKNKDYSDYPRALRTIDTNADNIINTINHMIALEVHIFKTCAQMINHPEIAKKAGHGGEMTA